MNLLWPNDHREAREIIHGGGRCAGKLARQAMLIHIVAASGGGTPARGMAFSIGLELVGWMPSGEVVTFKGGTDNGNTGK